MIQGYRESQARGLHFGWDSNPLQDTIYISFTPWGHFIINTYSSMFLGGGIKLKNLDQTHTENTINVSKES